MAIMIDYTKETGLLMPGAYVRLHRFYTDRNRANMEFVVYTSQENYNNGKPFEELIRFELGASQPAIEEVKDGDGNVVIEGKEAILGYEDWFSVDVLDAETNPYKQAYLYLMSLDKFKLGVKV